MNKAIVILLLTLICVLGGYIGTKIYFAHYKTLAEQRIQKVIVLQGANKNKKSIHVDVFDSKNCVWLKRIYFEKDSEIDYLYEFSKSSNEVRVSARYKNMSLELANKKAKYPLLTVTFDNKGNVRDVKERII